MKPARLLLATGAIASALSMSGCHEIFCGDAGDRADWVFELVGGVYRCKAVPEAPKPYAFMDVDPEPAAIGETIALDASASSSPAGPIVRYEWDLDADGKFDDDTGATASVSFSSPDTYNVAVRVLDSEGHRDRSVREIRVLDLGASPGPVAILDVSATSVPSGTTVRFDASRSYDPNGSITRHEWDFNGDGYYDQSGGPTTEHRYIDPGTFAARLRVTDNDDLTATAEQTIQVSDELVATFTIDPNPAPPFAQVTFDASGSSSDLTRFEWDLDGEQGYEVVESDPVTTRGYGEQYEPGSEIPILLRASNAAGDRFAHASGTLRFTEGPGLSVFVGSVFPPRPAASAGLRFNARLGGTTFGRHEGRLRLSPRRASIEGRAMIGSLRGSLGRGARGDPLASLLPATWIGRVSVRASRGARRVSVRGLAFATFERAPGTACLRFRLRSRGRRRTGTLVTLGGTGDGAQLAARARFRWRVARKGDVLLRGKITRRSTPPRPPSAACSALRNLRP